MNSPKIITFCILINLILGVLPVISNAQNIEEMSNALTIYTENTQVITESTTNLRKDSGSNLMTQLAIGAIGFIENALNMVQLGIFFVSLFISQIIFMGHVQMMIGNSTHIIEKVTWSTISILLLIVNFTLVMNLYLLFKGVQTQ